MQHSGQSITRRSMAGRTSVKHPSGLKRSLVMQNRGRMQKGISRTIFENPDSPKNRPSAF
jgi:hypothetical protein